jgi:hypothetical protein
MGSLARFDITQLCAQYACRNFLETGTGSGAGITAAMLAPFERIFSVEIMPVIAASARRRFAGDARVEIVEGASIEGLASILARLPVTVPALFWLDAHFPGADYGLASYDAESDVDLRLPLERELALINRARPDSGDVIIIDDLRIYLDGPFGNGNIPPLAQTLPQEARNIDFVSRLYAVSHDCRGFFEDEGYLVLTPRARAGVS